MELKKSCSSTVTYLTIATGVEDEILKGKVPNFF